MGREEQWNRQRDYQIHLSHSLDVNVVGTAPVHFILEGETKELKITEIVNRNWKSNLHNFNCFCFCAMPYFKSTKVLFLQSLAACQNYSGSWAESKQWRIFTLDVGSPLSTDYVSYENTKFHACIMQALNF